MGLCYKPRYIEPTKENSIANAKIIVMAYPQEVVRVTPAFYSKLLPLIGIGIPGFVRAGHACMILIKEGSDTFEYFDFGRYLTPVSWARARGIETDPDTEIEFKAEWTPEGNIANMEELIGWIYEHPDVTRGEGDLYASICENVNYERVKEYVDIILGNGIMHYGPFDKRGTNCARFVADAMLNGVVEKNALKRIKSLYNITPSVLGNVGKGNSYDFYYVATKDGVTKSRESIFKVQQRCLFDMGKGYEDVVDTQIGKLEEPVELRKSPSWKWLGGVGYGLWYDLKATEEDGIYEISQYSAKAKHIFTARYKKSEPNQKFDPDSDYIFSYPSHYRSMIIIQNEEKLNLSRL